MSRKRVLGVLSTVALKALRALRQAAEASDQPEALHRPTDKIDYLTETRRLAAEGSTVREIAAALDVSVATINTLMGSNRR